MTRAWAAVGSWTTEDCYSVDIDINHYGQVSFHTVDPRFRCLTPEQTGVIPTSLLSIVSDGAGGYVVTIPSAGGRIVEGSAEWKTSGGQVVGDPCTPGGSSAANVMRFPPNVSENGTPAKRCDIELTFCVPAARRQPITEEPHGRRTRRA